MLKSNSTAKNRVIYKFRAHADHFLKNHFFGPQNFQKSLVIYKGKSHGSKGGPLKFSKNDEKIENFEHFLDVLKMIGNDRNQ